MTKKLKAILAKDPSDLTTADKAYLAAHADELTNKQRVKFSVESEEEEDDEDEEEEVEEEEGEGEEEDDETDEEEGLDVESVKKLISSSFKEGARINEKQLERFTTRLAKKFEKSANVMRKKALEGNPVHRDEKAEDNTRAFLKALFAGDTARAKALTTSTSGVSPDDAQAGLLIPTELMTEVMRFKVQYGLCRRLMRYLPFNGPGNERTIPTLSAGVTVNWTDEGGAISSSQPTFATVTQTLKKLTCMVPFTEEILEDSAINLTELVGELIAEAVSKEEDTQFLNGSGSPWTGVLNNTSCTKLSQTSGGATNLTADDLLEMQDSCPAGAGDNPVYILHRTVLSKIRKLKDDNGAYIFQAPTDNAPGTIWGRPYELSEAMPTLSSVTNGVQYVIYGDLKKCWVYGEKGQMRVKLLTEATIHDTDGATGINLAEQDMIAIRTAQRVGAVATLPSGIVVLEAQATQS